MFAARRKREEGEGGGKSDREKEILACAASRMIRTDMDSRARCCRMGVSLAHDLKSWWKRLGRCKSRGTASSPQKASLSIYSRARALTQRVQLSLHLLLPFCSRFFFPRSPSLTSLLLSCCGTHSRTPLCFSAFQRYRALYVPARRCTAAAKK